MQYINIDVKKVKNMKIDLKSLIYSKLKQKYNFVWRSEIYDDRNDKQGVINEELTDYLKIIFP